MCEVAYKTADPALYGLLKQYVKELRLKRPTEAESLLWQALRGKAMGYKFRRQHIIGPFIADFCCLEKHLIIELDGGYHQLPEQRVLDEERQHWLEAQGFTLLRFTNEEVSCNFDDTITKIKNKII